MKKSDFHVDFKYNYTKNQCESSFEGLPMQFSDMAHTITSAFRGIMLIRIYEKDWVKARKFSDEKNEDILSVDPAFRNTKSNEIRPWIKKKYNKTDKHIKWTRPSYQVFVPGHLIHKGKSNERFIEGYYRYLELPRLDNVQRFYLAKL